MYETGLLLPTMTPMHHNTKVLRTIDRVSAFHWQVKSTITRELSPFFKKKNCSLCIPIRRILKILPDAHTEIVSAN